MIHKTVSTKHIAATAEEDRATTTVDMHINFVKYGRVIFEVYASGHTQTNR